MYEYTVYAPFCASENWNKMIILPQSAIICAEGGWEHAARAYMCLPF
jgi:hypothetical protein